VVSVPMSIRTDPKPHVTDVKVSAGVQEYGHIAGESGGSHGRLVLLSSGAWNSKNHNGNRGNGRWGTDVQ